MDDVITELEQITQRILDRLEDLNYEQITDFVEQREMLVSQILMKRKDQLPPPDMQCRIENLLKHDEVIMTKMNLLKQDAAEALVKVQNSKKQSIGYERTFVYDSVFFDKKK